MPYHFPSSPSRYPLFIQATGLVVAISFALLITLLPDVAHASTANTSAGNLPWEAPLESFRDSISGPVAFGVSIVGIVMCGAMLIWGGEINEFGRRGIMIVLVVALIVLANNVLTSLFTTAEVLHGSPPVVQLSPSNGFQALEPSSATPTSSGTRR